MSHSLSLSPHPAESSGASAENPPPTLLSLVTLSPSRAASCPDSQRRAQSGMLEEDAASITSHPQMLRGEVCAWMRERRAAASLPSLVPPITTHPVSLALIWKVRTRLLPPCPPTSFSQDMIGFLACSSASPLGLTTSLSVNTFALSLALRLRRHTPAAASFGREKAV